MKECYVITLSDQLMHIFIKIKSNDNLQSPPDSTKTNMLRILEQVSGVYNISVSC